MTISPLYTIHKYREDTFKVVCFKRNLDSDGLALRVRDPDEFQHNETKLDNNLSRARSMVLQYGEAVLTYRNIETRTRCLW